MSVDTVRYRTDDSVHCVATFWSGDSTKGVVVLLHMLGQDRSSWNQVPQSLAESGFAVLAPDFRGHGESLFAKDSVRLNRRKFKAIDFESMRYDVLAAISEALRRSKHSTASVIGAAFGANVAFRTVGDDPRISAMVLLSPGENYRGWTLPPASTLPVLAVAAADDDYSLICSRKLKSVDPEIMLIEYEKGGHGTYLFETQPQLLDSIVVFLRDAFH